MRLRFINVQYSVNTSLDASGPRLISPGVQEVLSELKSMSTAKAEKSLLPPPKYGIHGEFRQCLELANPNVDKKEYQMGLLQ